MATRRAGGCRVGAGGQSALEPGERLVLVIAQGSYGSDEDVSRVSTWELSPAATQPLQMHLGGEDAWLELPVIEREKGAYFEVL